MGAPKPTLGHPSRTEAVRWLRGKGLNTRQIAERIGIEQNAVAALECSARRRRKPRLSEANGRTVLFPADVLAALGPHATARGISANELARRIVQVAVDDELIDAILDDEDWL